MFKKLLQFLPFFLPFIGYAAYVVVARILGKDASWRSAPWVWLTTAGLALVVASLLVVWALDPRSDIDGEYVPPSFEDGEIRPGRVVPRQEQ